MMLRSAHFVRTTASRFAVRGRRGMSTDGPRKLTLSISAWFSVPEQGMKEFEILSRASAFLVPSRFDGKGKGSDHVFPCGPTKEENADDKPASSEMQSFVPKFHLVTVSHVVAPWLWPKYYNAEWLQHVNQRHTHYTVELRDEHGVFVTQLECLPVTYHHPNRDLAVLHLHEEDRALATLTKVGYEAPQLLLPPEVSEDEFGAAITDLYTHMRSDEHGGKLMFDGHDVSDPNSMGGLGSGPAGSDAAGDERRPIPQLTHGNLHGRTNAQVFCRTEIPLTDGMCGGPVLWAKTRSEGRNDCVVGMTEGIVPLDFPEKSMRGLAVFVESPLINDFLQDIEQGPAVSGVHPLIGGDAIDQMAREQHTPEFIMPDIS